MTRILAVLPGASALIDAGSGAVLRASAVAVSMGLVVFDRLASPNSMPSWARWLVMASPASTMS